VPIRKAKYPGRDIVANREVVRELAYRAMLGRTTAPWCLAPRMMTMIGLPSIMDTDQRKQPGVIGVACRKCDGCLRHRARLWTARAVDEITMSDRTWFGTLTVRPSERFRLGLIAEKRFLRASSENLNEVSDADRYRYLCAILGEECTKWLKRVRKQSGTCCRYLLVFERHKDGFPHCHLLLHEQGAPITKSVIRMQWHLGFTQVKLVDDGPSAAFYVAKYLAKEATGRLRASQRYGQGLQAFITERIVMMNDLATPPQR